jgi:hypothetical protein
MNQIRSRQVARLEKLAQPYIKRRQQSSAHIEAFMRKEAFEHVANLSLLILYGKPKIDEPLLDAWRRVLESTAWRECCEKHGGFDSYGREQGTPFDSLGAMYIAKYFHKYFMPELPGADETKKLDAIFETAPPWLLWFTYGDMAARVLGLKLPDLSSVNRFARGKFVGLKLPHGPFECHPLPDGAHDEFAVSIHKKFEDKAMDMTPRERKRTLRIYERYKGANVG